MRKRITRGDATLFLVHAQSTVDRVTTWLTDLMSRGAITEAVARISRLRLKDQAEVVSHMNPELQVRLLEHLSPDNLAEILGELEPGGGR